MTRPQPAVHDTKDSVVGEGDPHELPRLQQLSVLQDSERLDPVDGDDPTSYDLVPPAPPSSTQTFSLEKRAQVLFSKEHLQIIFAHPAYLLKFTTFISLHRPTSVPLLIYYLDALKSLRTIHYANAICDGLDPVPGLDFTQNPVETTVNAALESRANSAFEILAREELPAFITHQYINIVSKSISSRIAGSLAPHLRDASEGLAEVFCLTDPSRPDNPIVFASEEFNRTTQYGMNYIIGRNCRFLQGPFSNPHAVRRLREAIANGHQIQELLLN